MPALHMSCYYRHEFSEHVLQLFPKSFGWIPGIILFLNGFCCFSIVKYFVCSCLNMIFNVFPASCGRGLGWKSFTFCLYTVQSVFENWSHELIESLIGSSDIVKIIGVCSDGVTGLGTRYFFICRGGYGSMYCLYYDSKKILKKVIVITCLYIVLNYNCCSCV